MIEKALELEPELAEAYYERAELYIEDDKWELAERDLARVIQLDPNNVDALSRLGTRKISQGDLEEGVRLVLEAWSRETINDLDEYNAINSIALRYYRIGEIDSAYSVIERSLEINPIQPDLLTNLAGASTMNGKLERSNDYYNRILKLNPEDYFAMREMARNLTWLGEYEKAIELFEKSDQVIRDFEQTDKVPSSSHRLGYALVELGDSVRGWELINKVFDESLDRVEKGQLHNYAGEFYDLAAISAYRNNMEEALYWMGRCFKEGWYSTAFLKYDPMLESIRDHKIITDIIEAEEKNTRDIQVEYQKQIKELESKGQLKSVRTR
jgi:tetratricopeptide (TPR) repeat protein